MCTALIPTLRLRGLLHSYIDIRSIITTVTFAFTQALPGGHDDIDAVRLVRDPETLIGKGIGYILFKDRDSVLPALSLHEVRHRVRFGSVCNESVSYFFLCIVSREIFLASGTILLR